MKQHISKLLTTLALILTVSMIMLQNFAFAIDCSACSGKSNLNTQQAIQCGSSCASGNNQTPDQAAKNLNNTINTAINIMTVLVGAIAVIMVIIGGFRYITSAGNAETAKNARNTILYALVGLVIVAVAQIIVHYVIHTTNTAIQTPDNSGGGTNVPAAPGP